MKSWEIEKMLKEDSANKKRIGSGIYARKSTRRGGAGTVRFAKTKFKRYEKNSKTQVKNIYETIIPYKELEQYSNEMQRDILQEWVDRYSKERIKKEMKISVSRLDKLLKNYNIEQGRYQIVRANKSEMDKIKNMQKTVDVRCFRMLPDDQKFEIVDHWNQKHGIRNKEIARLLGYTKNSFNSKKSVWKKEYEKRDKNMNEKADFTDDFLFSLDDNEQADNNNVVEEIKNKYDNVAHKEDDKENKIVNSKGIRVNEGEANFKSYDMTNTSFNFEIKKILSGKELKTKIEALSLLLYDDAEYDVHFSIEEIKDK